MMRNKNNQKKKYLLALIVSLICSVTYGQKVMNLKQCIDTGIARNFDVEQRRITEESEHVNYKQTRLNLLPEINGAAGHSFNQGRSIDPFTNSPVTQSFNTSNYSLSGGLVVFNGLSRINAMKQAHLGWKASKMELQQEKDNLAINIILAYLQALSLSEQTNLVKEQAELSSRQVDRLNILNDEGAIQPSELSDIQGQLANDQLAIADIHNNLETARLNLFRLMNMKYDSTIILEKLDPAGLFGAESLNSDAVYQQAVQELAAIKAVDLRTLSAVKGWRSIKGMLWPTLRLGGDAYTQYSSVAMQNTLASTSFQETESYIAVNGQQHPLFVRQDVYNSSVIPYSKQLSNNVNTALRLSLNIPIFNALLQRTRVRQAKLEVKRNEVVAADTKRQLQQDIDQATINMQTAMEKYSTLLRQVKAYEQSFGAAEARFTEGVGNSIDYLTAKNNLDRASRNLVNARYDYALRGKILDFYKGQKSW